MEFLSCLKCKCLHVGGRESALRVEEFSDEGPQWSRQRALSGVVPYVNWFPTAATACAGVHRDLC